MIDAGPGNVELIAARIGNGLATASSEAPSSISVS
jgi:hypothetical protein